MATKLFRGLMGQLGGEVRYRIAKVTSVTNLTVVVITN